MAKRQYFMVLDVETANSTEDALVYDLGFVVTDKKGRIYERASYVISDIFTDESELMQTAYYANKLPQYMQGIAEGKWQVVTLTTALFKVRDTIKAYGIKKVYAYNASFDRNALNTTERWVTKSKYRYFLPYGVEVCDIWHLACQLLCNRPTYYKFAEESGLFSESGNMKTSAEAVWSYLSHDTDFEESHTGLEDVYIETAILTKCFAQHKKASDSINKSCWRIPQKKAKEYLGR